MPSKPEYKDPLPSQRRQKFTSGTYRGAYSQLETDRTFTKFTSKDSLESSGVVGSADVPPVGGVEDGRGTPKR
jgi:hypothetical protein